LSGPGGRSVSYESDGNIGDRKNNLCDYSDDEDEPLDIMDDNDSPASKTTTGELLRRNDRLEGKLKVESNDTH